MSAAAWAMPIWVAAQFSFNYALSLTSVTSNTILSSTSSFFTFLLSMAMLGERFTIGKVAAIGACIAGGCSSSSSSSSSQVPSSELERPVLPTPQPSLTSHPLAHALLPGTALMALKDTETSGAGSAPLAGDLLTVFAAALYAGYTVIMRRKMPGEEAEAHVATFFGYLGLYSTVSSRDCAFCPFGVFLWCNVFIVCVCFLPTSCARSSWPRWSPSASFRASLRFPTSPRAPMQ